MRISVLFAALVTTAACGGPGSFSGKVAGQGLDVKSAAFATLSNVSTGAAANPNIPAGIELGAIVLSNNKNVCSEITNRHRSPSEGYLIIMLARIGVGNAALTTGGYNTQDPNTLAESGLAALGTGLSVADFIVDDGQCNNVLANDGTATSGSVQLNGTSSGSSGSADGTFNFGIGPQNDPVSGTFSAPVCAGLASLLNQLSSGFGSSGVSGLSGNAINALMPCS